MFDNSLLAELFLYVQLFILGALIIWAYRIWHSEVVGTYHLLRYFFVELPRRIRGRKMVERAKCKGLVLVYNTASGVTGVCKYSAFKSTLDKWLENGMEEADSKKYLEWSLTRARLVIDRTFTYAEEYARIPAHTGFEFARRDMLENLVYRVTGYKKSQVSDFHFRKAVGYLVRREARLVVPLSGPMSGVTPEQQLERFGGLTKIEAEAELLPSVRSRF